MFVLHYLNACAQWGGSSGGKGIITSIFIKANGYHVFAFQCVLMKIGRASCRERV